MQEDGLLSNPRGDIQLPRCRDLPRARTQHLFTVRLRSRRSLRGRHYCCLLSTTFHRKYCHAALFHVHGNIIACCIPTWLSGCWFSGVPNTHRGGKM